METLGGSAFCSPADVADDVAVFAAAQAIENPLGPIEVWVNDAIVTVFSPISKISAAELRRVTEVTDLGAVYGTMAALHHMRAKDALDRRGSASRWRLTGSRLVTGIA